MTTRFVSLNLWEELKNASKASKQRCAVAVAYFGQGASKQLHLPEGSRLVVDASEGTVKRGLTCPEELLKMVYKGIAVYSVPNLHAKVYVLGRTAFIGSANVSQRSSDTLIEALIRTTDANSVQAAREFVHGLCLRELTPTVLKKLSAMYRPPFVLGGNGKRKKTEPEIPRVMLAQLKLITWSVKDYEIHDAGMEVAKIRRKHQRSYEIDSFRHAGVCNYRKDDVVIQVTDEGDKKVFVSPPGNVLYVRSQKNNGKQVSFVYLERPELKRRSQKHIADKLGKSSMALLQKGGVVRNSLFASRLLNLWM
jgi:formylmethanofuran dehydrogenase subunit D